jgi:predicted MPP superfamily phosphohydrolase
MDLPWHRCHNCLATTRIWCYETSFEELLKAPVPFLDMMMSDNRPDNIKHYVSRNANHMAELDQLKRGIVLTPGPNASSPMKLRAVLQLVA